MSAGAIVAVGSKLPLDGGLCQVGGHANLLLQPPTCHYFLALKKRKMTTDQTLAPTTNLLIKRLSDKAKLPTSGSALAAGYDLYRCEEPKRRIGGFELRPLELVRVQSLRLYSKAE